ncbi:chaperone modulator CbpM [Undibacterium sp. SXout20W]|uniref:chaperone modulator CbpM n=1 Tax=Undibacterium sp. SXout20W TaxID=3413051 RepID=UPI003BEFAB74
MKMKHTGNLPERPVEQDKLICNAYYLMEVSGLSDIEIDALIEHDLLTPLKSENNDGVNYRTGETLHFALHAVFFATCARRLRDDFELDCNGLILALNLMRRIDSLQEELRFVRACSPSLPFYSDTD